jgi:AraC family transcriptional regulator
MFRPFDLLENLLIEVEKGIRKGIRKGINSDILAKKYNLSERHLARLFRFAFKQPISKYIRSRKLTASLDDLLKTDTYIINVAMNYGFEYEQSYIRAFKREFGITPGDLRKNGKGQVIKVKPPLYLFDENKLSDGVLFGPDIVMVPQFHIIGKRNRVLFNESITLAPRLGKSFWENERSLIKTIINPNVYIGFTNNICIKDKASDYLSSVLVSNLNEIPDGLSGNTFESSLCARFRYIGRHHYYDINRNIAGGMYDVIRKFAQDEQAKYVLMNDKIYFEKIDTKLYDGTYCQMEWFSPVKEK